MIPGSRHTHMNQIMSIIDEISMIPGSRHTHRNQIMSYH